MDHDGYETRNLLELGFSLDEIRELNSLAKQFKTDAGQVLRKAVKLMVRTQATMQLTQTGGGPLRCW